MAKLPIFGKTLVTDIKPEAIAAYQRRRLEQFSRVKERSTSELKVANRKSAKPRMILKSKATKPPKMVEPKTVNLEIGTLRAILRYTGHWAPLQPNVKMLPVRKDVGRALSQDDETALLESCRQSRFRSLYVFVIVALYTGVRFSLIRRLRWMGIDFDPQTVHFGKGKTVPANFKTMPLGSRPIETLRTWAGEFPTRRPAYHLFPTERAGGSGHHFTKMVPVVYNTDPTKPMVSNKTAWQEAKKRCGIVCRMHDLRHTACSRMIDAEIPLPKIAKLLGWSDFTTVMMARAVWTLLDDPIARGRGDNQSGVPPISPPIRPRYIVIIFGCY
jgi:integrase